MDNELLALALQGGVFPALAVWLITKGYDMTNKYIERLDQNQSELLSRYESQQKELMDLLKNICLPAEKE